MKQQKTAHWSDSSGGWICSCCKHEYSYLYKVCPNCGCKMRNVRKGHEGDKASVIKTKQNSDPLISIRHTDESIWFQCHLPVVPRVGEYLYFPHHGSFKVLAVFYHLSDDQITPQDLMFIDVIVDRTQQETQFDYCQGGTWVNLQISVTGDCQAECSRCGCIVHDDFSDDLNYCPNCGTRMKKLK